MRSENILQIGENKMTPRIMKAFAIFGGIALAYAAYKKLREYFDGDNGNFEDIGDTQGVGNIGSVVDLGVVGNFRVVETFRVVENVGVGGIKHEKHQVDFDCCCQGRISSDDDEEVSVIEEQDMDEVKGILEEYQKILKECEEEIQGWIDEDKTYGEQGKKAETEETPIVDRKV